MRSKPGLRSVTMSMTLASPPQLNVSELLKKVTTIATLPEVTAQIIRTVEDPKSSAAQLHKIVSHDPALVTRVLKVANSAFYGLPGQIASIERAIVLLGLNGVKNIAVAASLGQLFRGAALCDGFKARDLWTHSVAVAVAARDLSRQTKLNLGDEAFLAGLIHDVGILVELQLFPDALREVCEATKRGEGEFCALERQMIGTDHPQLGMALAEQWKFPRPCQLVVGYHHAPANLADQGRQLLNLVHVADTLVCQTSHGFNLTGRHQKLDDAVLAQLHIDPTAVAVTSQRLDQMLGEVSGMLG